jgi:16S rRNA (cytosine967-C5)-methyltransferase
MQPAANAGRAHRQLAVFGGLLAEILPAVRRERSFPTWLQNRLGRDRRFGSRDRRIYRSLAYSAIRHLPWVESAPEALRPAVALWLAGEDPQLAALHAATPPDWPARPGGATAQAVALGGLLGRPISADELFPAWLGAEAPDYAGELRDLLLTRPPLWLRIQTSDPSEVDRWLAAEGIPFRLHPHIPQARGLLAEHDLAKSVLYQSGALEIQDIGSQLILALAKPQPGTRWLDACAGAGGKTLQLASLVGPAGCVDATDIRPAALAELRARAARAGFRNVHTPDTLSGSAYDCVLVDAPCSGSGTWRRSPHLLWQTTADDLVRCHERQYGILAAQAGRVRAGGLLVYATCSLARTENERTVERFLASHPNFYVEVPVADLGCRTGPLGTAILSHPHDGDSFFVALLRSAA